MRIYVSLTLPLPQHEGEAAKTKSRHDRAFAGMLGISTGLTLLPSNCYNSETGR